MKKPASLRAALTASVPDFKRNPDRLAMWIDKGSMRATQNRQRGFLWEYELTIVAENYTQPPELLFFLVVEWLRLHQPDLVAAGQTPVPFEVDIIDAKTSDVQITLALTEAVTATKTANGWTLEVVEEQPLFPDDDPLRDLDGPITSIWVRGLEEPFQIAPDANVPADPPWEA